MDSNNRVAPHPLLSDYYASEEDRRQRVDGMFDASAPHYDWINRVMSFGSGDWYREQALSRMGIEGGMNVLDAGTGTGRVALIEQAMVGPEGLVVALDPSAGMLAQAGSHGVSHLAQGLGEQLPFEDGRFDCVSMGYALRHVADLRVMFDEYHRVLRPGGKLLVLEITRPGSGLGHSLLSAYLKHIVPTITRIFRRSVDAQELMRYYWETIEHCVPPRTIMGAMQAAGLVQVERRVNFGIFSEYHASKEQQH